MSSVFKNFRAKFPRISQPAHEPAPRRKLPFATQAAREGQCGGILVSQNLRNRFTAAENAARHTRGRPCTTSVLRRIKNGYCSRLCLSGMQIQVLKYLRKAYAKRAQKTAEPYAGRRVSIHLSRRFPKYPFRNGRRDSNGRRYRAIRRQPQPNGKRKPPITTRRLRRTCRPIPAPSQSAQAQNTRNPLRIKLCRNPPAIFVKHFRRFSAVPPRPPYGRQLKRYRKRFATVPNILPEKSPKLEFPKFNFISPNQILTIY